jgi:peptidyl-prolyl cis-trans isomerase D
MCSAIIFKGKYQKMLQKIRKTADSIIFRIILGIIVISFAIWGVSDVAKGKGNGAIVTFKDLPPITYEDFVKAKTKEIKNIQRNEGISLSEEDIGKMGIDNEIIGMLVQKKLLSFIVAHYDIDFSDSVIADVIKTLPVFKDENGAFNIERFKSYLHVNDLTTEEYSDEMKNYIARTIILGSFIGNSYISNARTSNIIDFMSEKRNVDIATLSLVDNKKIPSPDITDENLRNFYNENKDIFKTPESRDICYAKIDNDIGKNNISVSDHEVRQFFDEYKVEFGNAKFDKVKLDIRNKLQKQKSDLWIAEISKSLEDEVAGGATLQEIADKYRLKRICEKNIMAQNIETKAGGLFAPFASQIYEITENEVSYPLENKDNGVILFQVTKHTKEAPREFESIKQDVAEKYKLFAYKQANLKKLQDFATNSAGKRFGEGAIEIGMSIQQNKSFGRAELANITIFPAEMLVAMFSSDKDIIVGPFIDRDKAYMFVVRNIFYDKDAKHKVAESKKNIVDKIKEGLMEELLFYVRVKSEMKMKNNLKDFREN